MDVNALTKSQIESLIRSKLSPMSESEIEAFVVGHGEQENEGDPPPRSEVPAEVPESKHG